ncbi:glycerol-3-phosphate dehydrogenase [Vibrio marisflavi]|uniref:Glycerol-3-phosphate dehydrogenase n=1 Tax=Vibrio marisflavi CECT 7928 TaxID=634439 RepID=A0ABM8ZZW3_9VIBR|nr:glycerol-3-phosphate dehydrogenase [Vibrio marisflavi]CAH0536730.1 Aerobic glycerol-3-phosphate dehydrogenase [Vibrio marisflavi CECT 7928]
MTMSVVKNETNNENETLDIIVVGGGINGAGIAADAAGRGLKVGLYDAKDFASATSSASSKLIHGGLRYLEHYEFRLVSEALAEREVILKKAPHIAFPMRFRLPHRPFLRPAWMIRAGLFLYDNLGKRTSLPSSKKIKLDAGNVTKNEMKVGFEYSDCWVDDARLVILNAQQAKEYGAEVKNYCSVIKAVRTNEMWTVTMKNHVTGTTFTRQCRALVNATGPWVKEFIDENIDIKSPYGIRLIKGSHIIVPKIHGEKQSYILQNEDKRIVFVIPYLDKFSLIGTTDVEYKGDPRKVEISNEECQYLVDVANKHFVKQISTKDIVSTFSGVRPLCDDESDSPQAITRDYTLSLDSNQNKAPLLSIFGGKLTTYRKLGESAMKHLQPFFPSMGKSWTTDSLLPGAESFNKESLVRELSEKYPFISKEMINRWTNTYGSRVNRLLKNVSTLEDLGTKFSKYLYQIEIDYLFESEFAHTAEDIIKRRTKLHLLLTEQECSEVERYVASAHHDENYVETKITA